MLKTKTFAVVGGDMRQVHLANALAAREDDYNLYAMFLGADAKLNQKIGRSDDIRIILPQSDVVIFPLPLLDNGSGNLNAPLGGRKTSLEDCLDYISPDAVVLAGKVPPEAHEKAKGYGIEIIDYLEREEFSILNAIPTAEGAVEIALRELPVTLFGAACLVTGYGRIAKVLARLLQAFGARVKVVARKYRDLAWIKANSLEAVHLSELSRHLGAVDALFNTVPSMILDEEKLGLLRRRCLIVDLASKPGGVDFAAAERLGLKAIHALSLPGKVAPESAGAITLDTIFNILREKGAM